MAFELSMHDAKTRNMYLWWSQYLAITFFFHTCQNYLGENNNLVLPVDPLLHQFPVSAFWRMTIRARTCSYLSLICHTSVRPPQKIFFWDPGLCRNWSWDYIGFINTHVFTGLPGLFLSGVSVLSQKHSYLVPDYIAHGRLIPSASRLLDD